MIFSSSNAEALKSLDLTSRDPTTRHHIARVDIVRLVSVFEYRCSLQVCLIQGVLYELLIGFMFVVLFSFCFTYCYVLQTKLASSLDVYKIAIDCVID